MHQQPHWVQIPNGCAASQEGALRSWPRAMCAEDHWRQ
eukprot:CAMPEP_0175755078 /NCGR_PEP_ID=MMETSP0097-20121207/63195_1 /TAXON_ID=311494 /ORGANISM="Alexandrium monilatum, Strain CCMP3105" /LENGTH=37 /DNA_ID= /DNA_START= /DNA_END= /DNA_ORIENTATION=